MLPVHNIVYEVQLLLLCCNYAAGLIITNWLILFIICCSPSPAGHVRLRTLPVAGGQKSVNVKPTLIVTSRRAVKTDEPELLLT